MIKPEIESLGVLIHNYVFICAMSIPKNVDGNIHFSVDDYFAKVAHIFNILEFGQ